MKILYLAAKERLTGIPDFKTVGLFNDQFVNLINGDTDYFPFPAAFVSFPDEIIYNSKGEGLKESDPFIVRVYIGIETLKKEELFIFDLAEKVHAEMEGTAGAAFAPFIFRGEKNDEAYPNIMVHYLDFETRLMSCASYRRRNDDKVENLSLNLNTELKIENVIIRTGRI
jgi:hypothetical protein